MSQKHRVVFLTSSPSGPLDRPNYEKVLDEKNGFVQNMKKYWRPEMRGLIVVSNPDRFEHNDEMKQFFQSGVPPQRGACDRFRCLGSSAAGDDRGRTGLL